MSEGYYEPNPKLGLHEFTDEALFDGIQRFQKDNGLRVDGIMKPGGETEKKINEVRKNNTPISSSTNQSSISMLDKMQALSTSGVQGLSYGYLDELNGLQKGAMYGVASLNSKWNKNGESFSEAFNRGYINGRDDVRELIKNGKKVMPKTMAAMETIGATVSPIQIGKVSETAPLGIRSFQATKRAINEGAIYGFGKGEGSVQNQITSTVKGAVGGGAGKLAGDKLYGRGLQRLTERGVVSNITNEGTDNLIEKTINKTVEKYKKK